MTQAQTQQARFEAWQARFSCIGALLADFGLDAASFLNAW